MAVERCAEALLVEVVADEADAAAEYEEAVERTNLQITFSQSGGQSHKAGHDGAHLDVLVSLIGGECAAVTEQVDEADGDAAIDVEDERVLLRRGDLLDSERVVEQAVAREVLAHVLLDELNAKVRVVDALDLVTNTRDYKWLSINGPPK